MQLFLDTAEVAEIREIHSWGILDGVTTNPTLIMKAGREYNETLREICSFVKGPVSAEAISLDAPGMVKEGEAFAKIGPQIHVKVPCTAEGLKAVIALSAKGIRTNVTLVFSALQALLVAKAGATLVSPFIGRLDDAGHTGMDVIRETVQIYRNYHFATRVLVASVRHPTHILEAAQIGADIATLPTKIFHQLVKHPLTDRGIELFLADWAKAKK